jgi:hypothetical protein
MSHDQKLVLEARINTYTHNVLQNNNPWHEKPRDALKEVQCEKVDDVGLPHWNCVLGRCSDCPTYPVPEEEKGTTDESPTIQFHVYENFTQCTVHGPLILRAKECARCIGLADSIKKGKMATRKHLTLLARPIGALCKYAYHLPHVIILGKRECGVKQQWAFENIVGSIKMRRDYAERLLATFNLEIQSEHFGNGQSLSIEGSTVKTHQETTTTGDKDEQTRLQFYSHFSNNS